METKCIHETGLRQRLDFGTGSKEAARGEGIAIVFDMSYFLQAP